MICKQVLRNTVPGHLKSSAHFSPLPVWAGLPSGCISLCKARKITHPALHCLAFGCQLSLLVEFPWRLEASIIWLNSTLGFYVLHPLIFILTYSFHTSRVPVPIPSQPPETPSSIPTHVISHHPTPGPPGPGRSRSAEGSPRPLRMFFLTSTVLPKLL